MNFDEHDGHDQPRVYVSEREPRYVGICPGHEGTGPWGPAVPYVPPEPNVIEEMHRIARQTFLKPDLDVRDESASDVQAVIDDYFRQPLPPSSGGQWQSWAISELALAALRGVERECPGLHYDVELSCRDDERRAWGLAKHFSAHDERFVAVDERRVLVSTDDIEDVAFLAGYPLRGALSPFITVLARSKDCVAGLYFDWDDDRFYLAEKDGLVLRHVLWAASASGLDIVNDDGEIYMMSGTPEYVRGLRAWIDSGSNALPQALL